MRKTDKKIDNQIRFVLTEVCETALKEIIGFQWLTHLVNYSDFPKSLKVVCVFDTNENLHNFMSMNSNVGMNGIIQKHLKTIDVTLSNIVNHVSYDTEEDCEEYNNGKWADRFEKSSYSIAR